MHRLIYHARCLFGWRDHRDDRGVTAVEFAIIAPVLFTMMIGILELSLLFFTQHVVENASFNVSRLSKTGYVEEGLTQEQTIKKLMAERTLGLLDDEKIEIESMAYSGYDVISDPEPFVDANGNGVRDDGENYTDVNQNGAYDDDQGAVGAGAAGEVVVYTIKYPWHMMTPLLSEFIGDDGAYMIKARVVVKNEPYDDGA
ncbi:MAG: TadE/TadG family type IV pilus assembly protein [Bdellovibrionales bacterium]